MIKYEFITATILKEKKVGKKPEAGDIITLFIVRKYS
jgi:hypothetical protein